MRFEELVKTLDGDLWVEIYSPLGDKIHIGKLKDLKYIPDKVMRIIPQSTSRQVYLEITVY
jgi:hypothetical protein